MNDVSRPLARFGDFELDYAAHELRRHGRPVALEGRAMALLILLVERPDELITREEIVARLWGSDAFVDVESGINTAVRKLRRALGDPAKAPRFIKTVQGKGYRFIQPLADASAAQPQAGAAPPPTWPRWSRIALAAVAGLGLALLVLALAPEPPVRPRVQVTALRPLSAEPRLRAFADLVADEVTGVMNESGVQTAQPPLWRWPSWRRAAPQFLFGGTVGGQQGRIRTRVYMADARSGLTLWTREFSGGLGDEAMLADAAAGAAAEVTYLALEPQAQKDYDLNPEALAAHIRGGVAFRSPSAFSEGAIRRAYEQLVTLAPGFALGHGELALVLAMEAGAASPPERAALQARATAEAQRALSIDPASAGYAYGALGILADLRDPTDLAAVEQPYRDGARLQPDFGPFHMRLCDVLTDVGRTRDALLSCERAVALRPMATPNAWKYAAALAAAGDHVRALRQIEKAARYDPEDEQVRIVRAVILTLGPDAAAARAFLHEPRLAPHLPRPVVRLIEAFLHARETRQPQDIDRAAREIEAAAASGGFDPGFSAQMLAELGRDDAALRLVASRPIGDRDLLAPALAPLRGEPAFWAAVERTGLIRYWTSTGTRPDFCAAPGAPAACATLARVR